MKYVDQVKRDVLQYISDEGYDLDRYERDEIEEELNGRLWIEDSVTGNASGSYTFNSAKAKEYVFEDSETVGEALEEFCCDDKEIAKHFREGNWEWFDVTARCYVLSQAISAVLDTLIGAE